MTRPRIIAAGYAMPCCNLAALRRRQARDDEARHLGELARARGLGDATFDRILNHAKRIAARLEPAVRNAEAPPSAS
jgi:hypothetical protein